MSNPMVVNNFAVNVWTSGYPKHVTLLYKGEAIGEFRHSELKDLEYAISRAREVIRSKLDEKDKWEA